MIHVVTYDLKQPNDASADYTRVIGAIQQAFPESIHLEESVWLIDTPRAAEDCRDRLKTAFKKGDMLFVARLQGKWASLGLKKEHTDWLHQRSF